MKRHGYGWLIAVVAILLLVVGCAGAPTPTTEPTPPPPPTPTTAEPTPTTPTEEPTPEGVPVKVVYMAVAPIGDFGWSYNGYNSLKRACDALEYCEIIGYSESVAEQDAEPYLRDYAKQGANLIIAHSFGYWEPAMEVTKDYPDLVIVYPGGDETMISDQVGTYYARAEETFYLVGMMAAMMTKVNHVGFVLPIQTPLVNAECWGFRQGVGAVNPDVEISYVATNSWYDPPVERESALALLDQAADFIAYDADSTAIVDAVGERGALVAGIFSDLAYLAPDSVVTSMLWPWDGYFTWLMESIHNGTWKSSVEIWGIVKGGTDITDFGPMVPQGVRDAVLAARQQIIDGTLHVETITDVCME